MRIALFPTCVVDAVAPEAGVATVRVLRRLGHVVTVPDDTTCCGQPAWNAGQADAAAKVARTTLAALTKAEADVVVVPAGSCATMIRVFWPELFEVVGDPDSRAQAEALAPKVREFSEFTAPQLASTSRSGTPIGTSRARSGCQNGEEDEKPVVYHHSCHMLRELGIEGQPEAILDAAGVERVESSARGRCCGFGGLFSVKLPEVSTAMADDVLDAAVDAGAGTVVGCDASCLMHLEGRATRRGMALEFKHLAEVVEDAKP
ncbi:MAG: (Fe-S)-binding protein [Actinobacteria bacterium]|nr:(Fe-S)-binding protein [Actinomycetota bacterium]